VKATVDDRSIGCGLCAEMCPEVFEMGQDELAHVKADPVPAEGEQTCQTASLPEERRPDDPTGGECCAGGRPRL